MFRRSSLPIVLSAAFAATLAAPAPAALAARAAAASKAASAPTEPRIFLSWNAPFGTPGATATLTAACPDSAAYDTLYLSFDPGRTSPDFRGVSATLYFHAAEGAALDDYWKRAGGGINGSPLRILFDSDPERDFVTLASDRGTGAPSYDFVSGSGRLRFIYAGPMGSIPVLEGGKRYGLARILVRRPAAGTSGCGVPMCVEWFSARLAYGTSEEKDTNRGERWAALNSPDGAVCGQVQGTKGVAPWKPGRR